MDEELFCYGCGAKLQTEDENQEGYVHPNALKRDIILCKRCFQLQHYGKFSESELKVEPLKLINQNAKKDDLIVLIVDCALVITPLTFDQSKLAKYNNILVVANRYDLYKDILSKEKVYDYLNKSFAKTKLNIIDILVVDNNIDYIFDKIDNLSVDKNVYIVGQENAGKTTFINAILKCVANEDKTYLTNSKYPGTTLNLIKIPLTDENYLIDSPGIKSKGNIMNYLNIDLIKVINSDKKMQASTYQLTSNQSLWISSFIKIDVEVRGKKGISLYFPSILPINRYKMEKADESISHEMKYLKIKDDKIQIDKLKKTTFVFNDNVNYDIVIEGIGFIRAKNAKISVSTYSGVNVFKRKSIL